MEVAKGFTRAYLNSGEDFVSGIAKTPTALIGLATSLSNNPLRTLNNGLDALRSGYRTAMSDTTAGREARGGLLFGIASTLTTGGLGKVGGANSLAADAAAIRANVLNNIADSKLARASSNFGQFSKVEGKLQETLGIWPPNSGGYSPVSNITLDIGTKVDRYGETFGSYVSPFGTSFGERALPSSYEATKPYFQYSVTQPIYGVTQSKVLPWFGQAGTATQFKLPNSVEWYLQNGYLK